MSQRTLHRLPAAGVLAAFCALAQPASAATLLGPFGSLGTQNLIANGDFETGTMAGFSNPFSLGSFQARSDKLIHGNYAARAEANVSFTGPGFAAISNAIAVTPGLTYVFSAFMYAGDLATDDHLYLDLNDVPFDVHAIAVSGIDQWQYVYETFIPTTSSINIRLVRDNVVNASVYAWIDNIGITLLSELENPVVAAPAPGAATLLGAGLLAFAARRRVRRSG
ncbi:MAG: hypothetical protein SFV21_05700 [Rhodospirillaceae bacterium]|nr:hypothetical protein [Rhodospirillaceae bacterium]